MRLLINALHAKSGGGLTYLRNMVPALAAADGVDLHLCVRQGQDDVPGARAAEVEVHRLDIGGGFLRLLADEQHAVPRLARAIGAEVTFSPANYGPLRAPGAVILLRNAPAVARFDRRPSKRLYWAGVYAASVASLLACRRAIAVSAYAGKALGRGLPGAVREKIRVVPHGVSTLFSPPPDSAAREGFVLAVSDIYVQKNFETLIRAFAQVRRERPELTLRIAGRPIDRDYLARLKALAEAQGVADAVAFLGQVTVEDLAGLYRRCALFVFPSWVETFGNPLLEAMASAAPVISSHAAAMPEVAGAAALYFDPGRVDDLAAKMAHVLDRAEVAARLSTAGPERAARFGWERTAAATLAVLREAGTITLR